ncbi:MAG: type III secretion protein [Candidatus Accumulibacter sp.]|jgi:type III secretion protein O|nr:type III secretion protein [Accumulibacter sp.]
MLYPLTGLMKIRDFRVGAARKAMQAAETRLRAAQAERLARERELERYRVWRKEEVERRYQSIMGRAMSQEEIEAFKAGLSALTDEELAREEALREAGRALEEARKNAQAARDNWLLANKEYEKIICHRDDWQKTQNANISRQEDLEQEEFKPLLFKAGEMLDEISPDDDSAEAPTH